MSSNMSNTRGGSRLLQSTTCRRHKQGLYMSLETIPKRHLTQDQINEKCEQLHKEGVKFRAKRQQASKKLQQMRQIEEMKECTFKPVLIENEQYFVPSTSFLDRQTTWHKTRTERITRKQEDKKKVELKNCSFKPSLIASTEQLQNTSQISNGHKPCKEKGSYLQIYKSRKEPIKTYSSTVKKSTKIISKSIKLDKKLEESSDTKDEVEHIEANPEKQEQTQPVLVEEDGQEVI